jgi:hypothetical protein
MKKIYNIIIRVPIILIVLAIFTIAAVFGCAATSSPVSFLKSPISDVIFPDSDGFIHRWLILEPIQDDKLAYSTIEEAVENQYFPDQLTSIPHDGDTVKVSGTKLTWHAVDTKEYYVDINYVAKVLSKPTSDILFWAVTIIDCPQEMAGARLAVGSNAPSVWWVNGQNVVEITCDCQNIIDGGVSKRLKLKEGLNIVRCAIFNGDGATEFWARFLDSDGIPLKGYIVNLSEADKLNNSGIVSND